MQPSDWLQLALFVVALAAITKPMGLYLMQVLDANGKTWFDPVLRPLERLAYHVMGVDSHKEHDWKQYTLAMLLFSLVGCLFTYAILRLQHLLPLNPQGLGALSSHLAFNTAVSFTTNTNWQSCGGESTMSYFSQMAGLAFHNFVSAATGIAVAAALVRGIARHSAKTLGNFWVDLVRTTYYLLLPICLVFAVFLVSQGMIQNFKPYTKAKRLEPIKVSVEKKDDKGETVLGTDGKPVMEEQTIDEQTILQGPMASQIAIKMLGTNGGGYVNANAAHPFENPTPLSNFFQMLSIFSIGSGLTYYLGRMVKNQKRGWAVWCAMTALFLAGVLAAWWLMVGRTPEYLGKKIQSYDVKMAMLSLLVLCLSILGFSAGAAVSDWGKAGLNNQGPHGLSEILYAFSSGTGNNGSVFAGLTANTPCYNTTLGLAMLMGRFLMIVPIMARAGSLVQKKVAPASTGTFPMSGGTFVVLLLGTVLLIGALNFLPVLTLGPIVEHFLTLQGKLF